MDISYLKKQIRDYIRDNSLENCEIPYKIYKIKEKIIELQKMFILNTHQVIIQNEFNGLYINIVSNNCQMLQYIQDQTPEICLAAVRKNGRALYIVPKELQTPELCLAAVSRVKNNFHYIQLSQPVIKNNIKYTFNKKNKSVLIEYIA